MAKQPTKTDFPVSEIRRYLEAGPVVLVSSKWRDTTNIMTMGWHMVMEFTPSLVACVISNANHSFEMLRQSRECVINVPTTDLVDEVIGIGNCSGAEVDKFKNFGLTPIRASAHSVLRVHRVDPRNVRRRVGHRDEEDRDEHRGSIPTS